MTWFAHLIRGAVGALAALGLTGAAGLAADKAVKVAVLNDQSSVYADYQGEGSVLAARMAAEDYGKALGHPVEVIFGDHQNKPDIGVALTLKWLETEGVDAILDVPTSSVTLAVAEVVRQKNKAVLVSGGGTAALTGDKCSPNTVHWTYDTYAVARSAARALVDRGGKKWFFITADYAFGIDLENQAAETVKARGGTVLGAVRHPIGNPDYASFLVQAQGSGADVLGLANAGGDLTNTIKQAAEFGIPKTMKMAGIILVLNNIHALGLPASQGLTAVNSFYWDLNDQTRAWSKKFMERHPKHFMPNDMQAGVYGALLHYLKAVDKVGGAADGAKVVKAMKDMPTDDPLFGKGRIRVDGRKIHPMYALEAKTPAQSKGAWDYFNVVGSIPGDEAFRPLADGHCPLVAAK
jgi:branched-chain amino acid transport system substrate-binding protein